MMFYGNYLQKCNGRIYTQKTPPADQMTRYLAVKHDHTDMTSADFTRIGSITVAVAR
jgi:hypothetical protein